MKILTPIFLLIFLTHSINISNTAMAATLPQPQCGFAGVADACCGTAFLKDGLDEALRARGLPKLPYQDSVVENLPVDPGNINQSCYIGEPITVNGKCTCTLATEPTPYKKISELCNTYSQGKERDACVRCAEEAGGLLTGFACVPLNLTNFITNFVLQLGIGLAGLIALLCITYSAFNIQTSQGDSEKIKKAQQQLQSCVFGLLLIIFSIFILRIIGVNILKIPGFS